MSAARAAAQIPPDLPGAELVAAGLEDLRAGRLSAPALLLLGARTRLAASGIELADPGVGDPERALYLALEAEEPAGAHGRYNALRRRLLSFCRAIEADARRRQR